MEIIVEYLSVKFVLLKVESNREAAIATYYVDWSRDGAWESTRVTVTLSWCQKREKINDIEASIY